MIHPRISKVQNQQFLEWVHITLTLTVSEHEICEDYTFFFYFNSFIEAMFSYRAILYVRLKQVTHTVLTKH